MVVCVCVVHTSVMQYEILSNFVDFEDISRTTWKIEKKIKIKEKMKSFALIVLFQILSKFNSVHGQGDSVTCTSCQRTYSLSHKISFKILSHDIYDVRTTQ